MGGAGISGSVHPRLFPYQPGISNAGGFRGSGSIGNKTVKYMTLNSSGNHGDWPDFIDNAFGRFTYFGDNKEPGSELHGTPRQGNTFLKNIFIDLHQSNRRAIPPCFIFTKAAPGHAQRFRGLAVPGAAGVNENNDLIAIWRAKDGLRFQNYSALFTILDAAIIKREWINDLAAAQDHFPTQAMHNAPTAWIEWVERGVYTPLQAPTVNRFSHQRGTASGKSTGEANT